MMRKHQQHHLPSHMQAADGIAEQTAQGSAGETVMTITQA